MNFLADISGFFGTTFGLVVVFVAGALIGLPLWSWVSKKFPWNN